MTELVVSATYVQKLAAELVDATIDAQAAIDKLDNISDRVWWTHGILWSMPSSSGFQMVKNARVAAGRALVDASNELAAKLDAAAIAYEGVDEDLSTGLDQQMVDG